MPRVGRCGLTNQANRRGTVANYNSPGKCRVRVEREVRREYVTETDFGNMMESRMSTRSSLWWADEKEMSLHLYEEMRGSKVCLEIKSGPTWTVLPLPSAMVKAIRESETCRIYAEHGTTDPDCDA